MNAAEVYPNAPVVLVAVEVRHPLLSPVTPAQQRTIKRQLSETAPIVRQGEDTSIEATVGAQVSPTVNIERFPRFFSRDSTLCASFREKSTTVETTRYKGWKVLLTFLEQVLRARCEIEKPDGIERVGLRYVDELRLPEQDVIDWTEWVDSGLLGPIKAAEMAGLRPLQSQSLSLFDSGDDQKLVVRYGPREGYAVLPGGDLKRPVPTPGPFFLVDIDSFWEKADEIPVFDVDPLLQLLDDLHGPVRNLFEALITDRYRNEVLRGRD